MMMVLMVMVGWILLSIPAGVFIGAAIKVAGVTSQPADEECRR